MNILIPVKGKLIKGVKLTFLFAICLLLITILLFSSFFLASGYEKLISWYFSLGSCFYRSQYWTTTFFTHEVKSAGNIYCMVAIVLSTIGLLLGAIKIKHIFLKIQLSLNTNVCLSSFLLALILIAFCIFLWYYGYKNAYPACDEVFSAQNVANVHPFQGVSYYMLPNNHLFYNLLNNIISPVFTNSIFSGRLLSLGFYSGFVIAIFAMAIHLLQHKLAAFAIAVTAACQFFVWGFSFQARGYELYLLCECGLCISLFAWIASNNKNWLFLNVACLAAGYFCMPSFLYLHAAQLLFILVYQVCFKKFQMSFWLWQAAAGSFVFLLYLPALCFSGYNAIGNNIYVAPMSQEKTVSDFCQWMFPYFKNYITHIFSDIHWNNFSLNILFSALPFIMLFSRRKSMYFLFGLFYLILWSLFLIIAIDMKRLPFERNLIGHYSISLIFSLVTIYWLVSLPKPLPVFIKYGAFCIVTVALTVHFLLTNPVYLKDTLYECDVNAIYLDLNKKLDVIPHGSSIGFSDNGFYCIFMFQQKGGYVTHKCATGNEDYYMKEAWDELPIVIQQNYRLCDSLNDFTIYKKQSK